MGHKCKGLKKFKKTVIRVNEAHMVTVHCISLNLILDQIKKKLSAFVIKKQNKILYQDIYRLLSGCS